MTDKEIELVEILANFWNEYIKLPYQHPCDKQEMCQAIHTAQHLIMIREMRRKHSDLFPIYTEVDVEVNSLEDMENDISKAVTNGVNKVFEE